MTPADLLSITQTRRDFFREKNTRQTNMISVYLGELHKLYPRDFPKNEVPIVQNYIKHGWDSFAAMVGKVPDKTIRPTGLSQGAQDRASKIEQIVYSYDDGDRMKDLMVRHSWYLVGLGQAVMGVLPDFSGKRPRFHVEDPRNVYPAFAYTATHAAPSDTASAGGTTNPDNRDLRSSRGGSGEPFYGDDLEDCVVERLATIRDLKHMFPRASFALGSDEDENLRRHVRVVQYYGRDRWMTVAVTGTRNLDYVLLMDERHDLGFVPWRVSQTFAPDQVGGISQFEEQVPLMLAVSRLLNQKLTYNDFQSFPMLWKKGEINSMRVGRGEFIDLGPTGEIGVVPWPSEFQVDRDLQTLTRDLRTLNREGPATTGDVSGGPITGRGLEQAFKPTDTIVQGYWNITSADIAALYGYALAIDEHFWPDEKKEFAGRKDGEEFEGSYIPGKDIAGHRSVRVSYGFGVGGVEGFLQGLQAMGAGVMSEETVMLQMPGIQSVSAERRRIVLDRVSKSIFMAFEAGDMQRAQYLGQIHAELQKGTTLTEALLKIPAPLTPEQQAAQAIGGMPGMPGAAPNGLPAGAAGVEGEQVALRGGATPPDLASLLQAI